MGTFDHTSKKSDSTAKPSRLTSSRFALQKAPAPEPTSQSALNPEAPINQNLDENGNPGWWSRVKFGTSRDGVQPKPIVGASTDQQQEADRPNQPAELETAPSAWVTQPALPLPHFQRQERNITPIPEQAMAQMRAWSAARSPVPPQPQPEPNVQAQSDSWHDRLIFNPQRPSMVQAKLTVGAPNDQYEQEADAVAAKVMAMPEPTEQTPVQREAIDPPNEEEEGLQTKPIAHAITPLLQREASPEADEDEIQAKPLETAAIQREAMPEDEEVQAKPIAGTLQREAMPEDEEAVQPKSLGNAILQREAMPEEEELQTKALNDSPIQREATAEADEEELQTKRLGDAAVQREALPDEEEAVQTKPSGNAVLQREAMPEEEETVQPKRLQRFADGSLQAGSKLETQLSSSRGGGSPLSDDVRSFMEPRFGADLSQVRVHTGASAVQMNKDLSAQAFTHKQDIFFGAGKSPGKNDLTAHELTHVVQQTGARKPNKGDRLHLKQKEKTAVTQPKQQDDLKKQDGRDSSHFNKGSHFNKESEKPLNPPPADRKAELPPAQFQPNKEVPLANQSPVPKPIAGDAATSGGNRAKLELAPEPTKPKVDATSASGAQTAAQGSPSNLAAAKPEGAIPDTKPAMGEGAAVGGVAAAPVPQADAAPAVGDVAGGSAEGEAEQTGDDKELEAAATATEGVELAAGDRANATASLAEVADSGGAPAEGGGGGGGGGAAIADKPAPPVPDVSGADPAQAIAAISQLPPAQLQAGLGGVTAAVGSSVSKERAALAANPPQMERPTGSPMTKDGTGDRATPANKPHSPVEKAPQGQAKPTPQPQPLPPLPPPPTQSVPQPGSDPQAIKASLDRLPTHDPNLNVTAGSAPPLALQGDADPQQAQAQKAKLEKSVADTHAQGQQELAQPMGEDEIYPHVPKETLKAEGIGGSAGGSITAAGGAGGGAKGAECDDAISVIAQQEHGQEIQAAVSQAQSQMAAKRQEHTVQAAQEKEKSNKDIAKLQSENEAQQAQERSKAQTEVSKQKESWNKEQTALVNKAGKDSDAAVAKGMKDVQQEQTQAETKANQHIEKGNQEAETARKQGEEQATAEKQKANQESGGIFGWLADKAKAFFDGIKQAIQKAFEFARAAVKLAIETAKKLATEVIEAARKAIVAVIKFVGDALIAIGDVLLAAFPEMRDRFRNAIKSAVKAAETAVNFLADTLKKGVLAALTLLGKGLDAALGLLEKGLLLAVDIAKTAVQGAIAAAKAAVDTLGAFAVLAKDIAANPGQWISNLGAGVMDGIRNHLWTAFQAAVKDWFNQKVEEVLGLGLTIWNLLKKGGMGMAEIGHMAWEGIKSAIPPALIQILIEKLVALIVPAAGAVLAVIEGIQAAWGTVSRILQAMDRFMAFLKVVKTGQSGPQFGQLLAAAGIILIDFAANWLLKKVRGAASKVAGKIKEIAKKIGDKLKKAMKKLGKKLRSGMKKLGDKAKKLKEKFLGGKGKESKNKQKEQEDHEKLKRERLNRAVQEVKPSVDAMLKRGVPRLLLKARLAMWRVRYRIRRLELVGTSNRGRVEAANSPTVVTNDFFRANRDEIFRMIVQLAKERFTRRKEPRQNSSGTQNAESNTVRHQPGRDPDAIGDQLAKRNEKGEVLDVEVGGETFAARVQNPKSNIIIGERQGQAGTSVHGRPYYEIAENARRAGISDEQLAEQVFETFKFGKAPSREAAELGTIIFGSETARTPLAGVTGRLSLLGMRQGLINAAETLGTAEVHRLEREVRKRTREEVARLREQGGSMPSSSQEGASKKRREVTREARQARRESGGVFPSSMRGFVPTERETQKSLEGKAIRAGTEKHADVEELKNRTVQLVYKVVGNKDYDSVGALRLDIIEQLKLADEMLGIKQS